MTTFANPIAEPSALPEHVCAWALVGALRDGTADYLLRRFMITRHDPGRPRVPGHSQRSSDEHHP